MSNVELERRFLEFAYTTEHPISATAFAFFAPSSIDAAATLLDGKSAEGMLSIEMDENGGRRYIFPNRLLMAAGWTPEPAIPAPLAAEQVQAASATTATSESPPEVSVTFGATTRVLEPGKRLTLGRDGAACDLALPAGSLSPSHAEIWLEDRQVRIRDLGSANGTWVDGFKVGRAPVVITSGREVALGPVPLAVTWAGEPPGGKKKKGAVASTVPSISVFSGMTNSAAAGPAVARTSRLAGVPDGPAAPAGYMIAGGAGLVGMLLAGILVHPAAALAGTMVALLVFMWLRTRPSRALAAYLATFAITGLGGFAFSVAEYTAGSDGDEAGAAAARAPSPEELKQAALAAVRTSTHDLCSTAKSYVPTEPQITALMTAVDGVVGSEGQAEAAPFVATVAELHAVDARIRAADASSDSTVGEARPEKPVYEQPETYAGARRLNAMCLSDFEKGGIIAMTGDDFFWIRDADPCPSMQAMTGYVEPTGETVTINVGKFLHHEDLAQVAEVVNLVDRDQYVADQREYRQAIADAKSTYRSAVAAYPRELREWKASQGQRAAGQKKQWASRAQLVAQRESLVRGFTTICAKIPENSTAPAH